MVGRKGLGKDAHLAIAAILGPLVQFVIFFFLVNAKLTQTMADALLLGIGGAGGTLAVAAWGTFVRSSARIDLATALAQLGSVAVFFIAPWSEGARLITLLGLETAVAGGVLAGFSVGFLLPSYLRNRRRRKRAMS